MVRRIKIELAQLGIGIFRRLNSRLQTDDQKCWDRIKIP